MTSRGGRSCGADRPSLASREGLTKDACAAGTSAIPPNPSTRASASRDWEVGGRDVKRRLSVLVAVARNAQARRRSGVRLALKRYEGQGAPTRLQRVPTRGAAY